MYLQVNKEKYKERKWCVNQVVGVNKEEVISRDRHKDCCDDWKN